MSPADADHERFMALAIAQARLALAAGEVPIGAVIVAGGAVLAEGFNRPVAANDPTAHAEIVALRHATGAAANYRLPGATLYVTLEPCLMCAGAMLNARLATLVYGAAEPKWGAIESVMRIAEVPANHRFGVVAGVLESECRRLMVDFFRGKRAE